QADGFEAEALVQSIGGRVGLRDAGDDAMDILFCQQIEERLIQLPAYSPAGSVRAARDACLNRRLVGFLRSKTPGAGIAYYPGLEILGHEQAVAVAIRMLVKPGYALLRSVRLDIESDVRIENVVVLDLGQAAQIGQLRRSNCEVGHRVQDFNTEELRKRRHFETRLQNEASVCFFSLRDSASS